VQLAEFVVEHRAAIVKEWEAFARSLMPAGGPIGPSAARDHADEILTAIVSDMTSARTDAERVAKSKGRGEAERIEHVAHIHALMRIDRGFRLDQVVAEFRALRASVLLRWNRSGHAPDIDGVMRFNEAIDEALSASVSRFTETMDRYRDQFVAILGHDLRSPLGGIVKEATALAESSPSGEREHESASRILSSATRMDRLVRDLLDLTRTRLGSGLPIKRAPMDLEPLCRLVLAELAGEADQTLRFEPTGDLHGEWDSDRLAQVVSNLVGIAIKNRTKSTPVTLIARGEGSAVELEVHYEGAPLPPGVLGTMFEPMVHVEPVEGEPSSNLGLSLYIAEQIVTTHGGAIGLTSTKEEGTRFTVSLPRRRSSASG
jgi:signal transduction histidine kinase